MEPVDYAPAVVDYATAVVGAMHALVVLYIGVSAYRREMGWWTLAWVVPALILSFLVIPFFRAFRPLKADETRSGGKIYLVLRDFARMVILLLGISFLVVFASGIVQMQGIENEAEEAGSFAGISLSAICILPIMLVIWIIPQALRSDQTEEGPTGPLAE
jgi:heme/copper-type cytochrome/quinol oxidase subunit 2